MFATIQIDSGESDTSICQKFNEKWKEHKVIRTTGCTFQSEQELRDFYDRFMELVGQPAAVGEDATSTDRNSEGQRTGQRWTEIRYDPTIPDAYRHSANPQPLHTDGSYVPEFPDAAIIYCQSSANNGGETVFLDSSELLRIMSEEAPELLARLESNIVPHWRAGNGKTEKIIDSDELGLRLSWNYYCVAPDVDDPIARLKEEFHHFLKTNDSINDALVPVALRPGEAVVWKDDRVLHGRNGFNPDKPSERFLWKSAFASNL